MELKERVLGNRLLELSQGLRIHYMELKDVSTSPTSLTSSEVVVGIHYMELKARDATSPWGNPIRL